jgi:hypothetical protein
MPGASPPSRLVTASPLAFASREQVSRRGPDKIVECLILFPPPPRRSWMTRSPS